MYGVQFVAFSACRVALHPLAVVKIHQQARQDAGTIGQVVRDVVRSHGVRGLWRGLAVALTVNAPAHAVHLTVLQASIGSFGRVADFLGVDSGHARSGAATMCASILASIATQAVLVPGDVVAARWALSSRKARGIAALVCGLVSRHGISGGLFRGYSAALALDLPYSAIWWGTYGASKSWVAPEDPHAPHLAVLAACGVGASLVAVPLTHLVDTAKTRVQVGNGQTSALQRVLCAPVVRAARSSIGIRSILMAAWGGLGAVAYELSIRAAR